MNTSKDSDSKIESEGTLPSPETSTEEERSNSSNLSPEFVHELTRAITLEFVSKKHVTDLRQRMRAISNLAATLRLPEDPEVFRSRQGCLDQSIYEAIGNLDEVVEFMESGNSIRGRLRSLISKKSVAIESYTLDSFSQPDRTFHSYFFYVLTALCEPKPDKPDIYTQFVKMVGANDGTRKTSGDSDSEDCSEESQSLEDELTFRIGRIVWRIRELKQLSQSRLATLAGISQAALSLIERGKRTPSISVLARLARGLGVPLSEIILFAEDPIGNMNSMLDTISEKGSDSRTAEPDENMSGNILEYVSQKHDEDECSR